MRTAWRAAWRAAWGTADKVFGRCVCCVLGIAAAADRALSMKLSSTLNGPAALQFKKNQLRWIACKTASYLNMSLSFRPTTRGVISNIGKRNTAASRGKSFLLYSLRLGDNGASRELKNTVDMN